MTVPNIAPPPGSRLDALTHRARNVFARGILPSVVAGLLLALAFPKTGIAGFAWIAPGLMVAAAQGKRGKVIFGLGYLAGLAQWLVSLNWLLNIPVTGYPILGWAALSAFVALFTATWVWLTLKISDFKFPESWFRRTIWALAGAALWVALEMLRARIFSGFPWSFIGVSQYKLLPLIQIASATGVYGVSFLVVWGSLSMVSAVRMVLSKPTMRYAWLGEVLLPLAALGYAFGFGMARLNETPPLAPTTRITLIQPAVPQTMIWNPAENTNRFQKLMELSETALTNRTDLLIWPEAALPELNETTYQAITNLVVSHRIWMIFGADEVAERENAKPGDDYDVYNSALLFDPAGRWMGSYRKQNLVIFGEYIPLLRWMPFLKWFTPIDGGFAAGKGPVPFNLEIRATEERATDLPSAARETLPVKTSVLICFEDTFPQHARHYAADDTDFLVNITNDGWFGEGAAQRQQAANAVFRAVENGLPLIRCCNNGLTCWVDAHGRLEQIFADPTGSEYGIGAVTLNIPLLNGEKRVPTFYNRHGDWFGWTCVGLAIVVLVRSFRRKSA